MNTFPVAVILTVFAFLLLRMAWRALRAIVRVAAHEVTMWRLSRICGSRARANRLVRAAELETRNNALLSLATSPASSRSRVVAEAVGRPAPQGVPRHPIGDEFPQLMFARRQAD